MMIKMMSTIIFILPVVTPGLFGGLLRWLPNTYNYTSWGSNVQVWKPTPLKS